MRINNTCTTIYFIIFLVVIVLPLKPVSAKDVDNNNTAKSSDSIRPASDLPALPGSSLPPFPDPNLRQFADFSPPPVPAYMKELSEKNRNSLPVKPSDTFLANKLKSMDKKNGAIQTAIDLVMTHSKRSEVEKFCAPCPHCHSREDVVPVLGFLPYLQEDYDFGFVNKGCNPTSQDWYCRKCKASFYPYRTDQMILDAKFLTLPSK